MTEHENEDQVTKEDVIGMLVKRQRLWLDASVVIANMLPMTWDVIEGYLAETQNVTNLLLTDLRFDSITELLTYSVFEQGSSIIFNVPVPISLAVDPGEEGEKLFEYLNKLPVPAAQREQSETQDDKIRSRLQSTMYQHPGMFMDLDRLVELERQSAAGEFIKYPVAEKLQ